MSTTSPIYYDVEAYPNFLFSYEEYLSTKSRAELPIRCSHCDKAFYRQKKQITRDIKEQQSSFYCCKTCQSEGRKKPKENKTYACKLCGKTFTELPGKYASGDFCSTTCAKRYANKFANTYEIRKKKSDDMCDKLGIPHKETLDKRAQKGKRSSSSKIRKQCIRVETLYHKILELYDEYNFLDIQRKLGISYNQIKTIRLKYHLQSNPKFLSSNKTKVISFCKAILHKETSITVEDYNQVKDLLLNHLYEDKMSPTDIKNLYKLNYTDFGMFLKKGFDIKLRSLSEAVRNYNTNIGIYENKDEKEIYYLNCAFRFGLDDFKRVEGFDLIAKYGMYSPSNTNGVARDHMVSRYYGWTHKIPPEVIRHPANCRIINQRKNSSKGEDCCITAEELYERIENW